MEDGPNFLWPSQNIRTLFGQHAHSLAATRPVFVPSGSKKHGQPVLTPPILTPGIKDLNCQVLHTEFFLSTCGCTSILIQ